MFRAERIPQEITRIIITVSKQKGIQELFTYGRDRGKFQVDKPVEHKRKRQG